MFLKSGCRAIPKPTATPFNRYNMVVFPNKKCMDVHTPPIKTKHTISCMTCVNRKHLVRIYIIRSVLKKLINPNAIIFKRYKCIYTML